MKNSKKQQLKDRLAIIKYVALTVLFGLIMIAGMGCGFYAAIMQCVLIIKKYGALIDIVSFIPHESAWFFIGFILAFFSYVPLVIFSSESKRLQEVYKARKRNGWYKEEMEENV